MINFKATQQMSRNALAVVLCLTILNGSQAFSELNANGRDSIKQATANRKSPLH